MATSLYDRFLGSLLCSLRKGWLIETTWWSERSRDLSSWIWPYGFDIQNDSQRRWVCQTCVVKKRVPIASYKAEGTQNIERHLNEIHEITEPSGKRKRPLKQGYPSVADLLHLDREEPQQLAFANTFIKRFDRVQFQKLLVNWIVEGQHSFREVESESLRAIFEYLNPCISVQEAHQPRYRSTSNNIRL